MAGVAACLVLASCGSEPVRAPATQATIADLGARPIAEDRVLAGDARDKAIDAYVDYLQRYPASQEKTRIQRRVADLLLGRASDARATVPISADAATAAQRDYAAAIDLYRQLLAGQSGQRDDIQLRYQLARAYEESGQAAQANDELQHLVQRDQVAADPKLYADAQFRRGELFFAEGAFPAAERAYRAVLQLGDTVPVYRQARYKLAWTLYKMADYQQALTVFFAVVDSSIPFDADPEKRIAALSGAEQEQLKDVFRGISLSFSHLGGAESVDSYFQRHGGRGYEARVYLELAELFVAKAFFNDAAESYLALARRDPLAAESALLYIRVIDLYRQAGLAHQVLQVEADLVRDYAMNEAFLAVHPLHTLPDLTRELQSSLIDLARHDHAKAISSTAASDYRAAEQWYRVYLELFPDARDAAQMNLGLAGLYYDSGQYLQAAIEYENTAYGQGEHPGAAQAGRSALDAHARHLAGAGQARPAPWSERSLASAVRFVENFPEHTDAPAVFASVGVELLERDQVSRAIAFSEQVLQLADPDSALRPLCWSLLGQARYQLGDYRAAEQAYRQALASTASGDAQYAVLEKGLAASLYSQAEQNRQRGDLTQSSQLFQRAAEASSDPAIRGQARYDAAADLLAREDWRQAALVLEKFRTEQPQHPLQPEALRKLAFAYEQDGRDMAAASEYRRLAATSGDQELRREALLRAAALYQRAGNSASAIDVLKVYSDAYPHPPERLVEVYHRLATLYQADGDEVQRRHWLTRLIAADKVAGDAADQRSHTLAAQASLVLAERQLAKFRRIELVEPLQTTLSDKLQALRTALEAFEQANSYDVPTVNSAATYHIAVMYQELSLALLDSERPTGLNATETEQYDQLIAEQAEPFRSKAIEIHEANLRRVTLGYYDDWIAQTLRRLAELWPERYAKEERGESFVPFLR